MSDQLPHPQKSPQLPTKEKEEPPGTPTREAGNIRQYLLLFPAMTVPDKLDCFTCAWSKEILWQGRMYITPLHVSFSSKIFGSIQQVQISYDRIKSLHKKSTACVIPNAIRVCCIEDEYVFTSFLRRDYVFDMLDAYLKKRQKQIDSQPQPQLQPQQQQPQTQSQQPMNASLLMPMDSQTSIASSGFERASVADSGLHRRKSMRRFSIEHSKARQGILIRESPYRFVADEMGGSEPLLLINDELTELPESKVHSMADIPSHEPQQGMPAEPRQEPANAVPTRTFAWNTPTIDWRWSLLFVLVAWMLYYITRPSPQIDYLPLIRKHLKWHNQQFTDKRRAFQPCINDET